MYSSAPTISFDVDGVLLHGANQAFAEHLRLQGNLDESVFAETHSWFKATGYNHRTLSRLFACFLASSRWLGDTPVAGAPEAIASLCLSFRLIAVTARSHRVRQQTQVALMRYFPDMPWQLWTGAPGRKEVAYRSRQVVVHVEDSLYEASRIAEHVPAAQIILFPSFLSRITGQHPRVHVLAATRAAGPHLDDCGREALLRDAWQEAEVLIRDLVEKTAHRRLQHVVQA